MKIFHSVYVRFITKKLDDIDIITNAILKYAEIDQDKKQEEFDKQFKTDIAEGMTGDEIYIMNGKLKAKYAKKLFENLYESFSDDDKKFLFESIESRVDDTCTLFVRIKLDDILTKPGLTDSGECLHLSFQVAAYPAKREKALMTLEEYRKLLSA